MEKYGSDYFEKLFNFFDTDIRNTKMMQNIHHVYDYYRHRFPIDESFNIFNAPETEARKRLVEMSRPQYYSYLDDLINSKELNIKGSFRFHNEFKLAVHMMQKKLLNVKPLVTHTIPLSEAEKGFGIAMDSKQRSMKVQIA